MKMLAALLLFSATAAPADPLVFHNGRLFVQVKINGTATEALLDSAAEASIVDPKLAAAAKLPEGQAVDIRGSGGEAKARFVEGVTLEMLGQKVPNDAVVVSDLTELSGRLLKRPTQMIVGREAFDAMRLAIDIQGGTVAVASGDPAGTKLPLTEHAGVEAIPVTVGATPAQAEFDVGNGSDVMVSRAFATKAGLKVTGKKPGGGIGGELLRDTTVIPALTVAGVTYKQVPASIDDQPNANDLNIGTSILKDFLIVADFKQRAVWLAPRNKQ
jgi:hypothetical protein